MAFAVNAGSPFELAEKAVSRNKDNKPRIKKRHDTSMQITRYLPAMGKSKCPCEETGDGILFTPASDPLKYPDAPWSPNYLVLHNCAGAGYFYFWGPDADRGAQMSAAGVGQTQAVAGPPGVSGLLAKANSPTGFPRTRCSWMMRSNVAGVQE